MRSLLAVVVLLLLHGSSALLFNESEEMEILEEALFHSGKEINFFLYTKENPNKPRRLHPTRSKQAGRAGKQLESYNSSRPSIFVTHGHGGSRNDESIAVIKAAYEAKGDYNIITIDWSKYAALLYPFSIMYVREVGASVAKMVDKLVGYGSDPADITLVGHSLGAHVVGSAGKQANSKVGRIVGLDPAGPLFGMPSPLRISKSDAQLVEIIHTCGSLFGLHEAVGHVDFFPNGGRYQVGCENEYPRCDHLRSYHLYAEAIRKPDTLVGVKCNNYDLFLNNDCKATHTLAMAFNKKQKLEEGSYYLKTNGDKPFGMGLKGIRH